jgi:DNA-directed RNA polymerase sigma subunit (sigma70/sigma32)
MKCYNHQEKFCSGCKITKCRYWLDHKASGNCVIVASKKNENWTLQDVGSIFGVTRMRICQIEKTIINKIKKKTSSFLQ